MNSPIAHTVLADLDHEIASTRKVLKQVPEAHLDYAPHGKSMKLGKLAHHLTEVTQLGWLVITTNELDFAAPSPPKPPAATTAAGFLEEFDAAVALLKSELSKTTDAHLSEPWVMRSGAQVWMNMPRLTWLRVMITNHLVHHRAQLTLYYRMLDLPMPGMYGPSADEM